ncbi:hypothetical protein LTR37_015504 [Vermiconidia calcicola]|uniref:Uncharacterized protein n=1 Tax=Vermiconidia calcicola TaxID=1690605 RepID=A0ACC3MQN0_9PEZI|nr:hypothetical protein LTR37_015504 [Vermiconidia calcicola]
MSSTRLFQGFLRSTISVLDDKNNLRRPSPGASLLKEMEGFHPALLRVAELATDVLPLWRYTTRKPMQKLHRGRVVVIGDTVHPVKPHLGLGAISAIEDAAVLGELIKDVPISVDLDGYVSQRLDSFDKFRTGRVAA